ncbi:protein of unknown function [Paraburkholderia dioscoreae]|uniref:Uncharacterized protein n=1 Tax=Paraburkholderia dioscoreae TaxID=2604047 RepID=A0A5Q4Z718_9BURK|nr:protein of unknown function [Paraburkholderia dioscoreae]
MFARVRISARKGVALRHGANVLTLAATQVWQFTQANPGETVVARSHSKGSPQSQA